MSYTCFIMIAGLLVKRFLVNPPESFSLSSTERLKFPEELTCTQSSRCDMKATRKREEALYSSCHYPVDTLKLFPRRTLIKENSVYLAGKLDSSQMNSFQKKLTILDYIDSTTKNTRESQKRTPRKLYESISNEVQINASAQGDQSYPFVLKLSSDRLVIIWADFENGGRLMGQLVDANLNKIASEFQINAATSMRDKYIFKAATLSNGFYIIVWEDGINKILAKIFNGDTSQGPEFQVNSSLIPSVVQEPQVTSLASDEFVVFWYAITQPKSLKIQRFNNIGLKIGGEIEILSSTNEIIDLGIALLDNGELVATWTILNMFPNGKDIFVRLLDNTGNPIESASKVNESASNDIYGAKIAALSNESYVVAWSDDNGDGYGAEVYAQTFSSFNVKLGSTYRVNTERTNDQYFEDIVALYNGDFLITWRSSAQDGDDEGVYAQRFSSSSVFSDSAFLVNVYTDSDQDYSNIGATECGFIVTWMSSSLQYNGVDIAARSYKDTNPTISIENPLQDMSGYLYHEFSFTVPSDTFIASSVGDLTYSAAMKIGEVYQDMESSWLSFDSDTRTFSGVIGTQQDYTIEVTARLACSTITDTFILTVLLNSEPFLSNPVPPQLISFNSEIIWEFKLPPDTFEDLENDTIIYSSAYIVIQGEEKQLNSTWETLSFDGSKIYGIPNLAGEFTVRVYVDDGYGDPSSNYVDIKIQILSLGIEFLELYSISQTGSKGLISQDGKYLWISNQNNLRRFELTSSNPLFVEDFSLEYTFLGVISDIEEISEDEIMAGDDLGHIQLLSASSNQQISALTLTGPIADIYREGDSIYVSSLHSVFILQVSQGSLEILSRIDTTRTINSIAKINDTIYAASANGILEIDIQTKAFRDMNLFGLGLVHDISVLSSYMYALNDLSVIAIDITDQTNPSIVSQKSLLGVGASFFVFKKDGDTLCLVFEVGIGVSIINLSNPESLFYEGFYQPLDLINGVAVESTGQWGIVLKSTEVHTVEMFRREILIEICDTHSDPCENVSNIQANIHFSKDLTIKETSPTYKPGYIYGLSYSFSAYWIYDDNYNSLPDWLVATQSDTKVFTISGEVPDIFIGSEIIIEVQTYAYDDDIEEVYNFVSTISLTIDPREASVVFSIPDQYLEVGNEWVYSFPESTFSDADEYDCEYEINSEWKTREEISYIQFTAETREWVIAEENSTKETLLGCSPCDSTTYSESYVIKVIARNSNSKSDPGVSTTFNLFIYSGKIADQEIHPGISQSIILDEDIFPVGGSYTVSLLNDLGETESLPDWMSYISNERKILMFPSASEVGQDFDIEISGQNDDGTELKSQFVIKVTNADPVNVNSLEIQRVKLGSLLDYSIPEDTFSDPDNDILSYSVKWLMDDGTETSALPSWLNFNSDTQTLYGVPSVVQSLVLIVYANDGLGGETNAELSIEAYNNKPQRNIEISLDNQSVHIGDLFYLTISPNLFTDSDGDDLSYSSNLLDGSSLPSWLSFSSLYLTFSGTPVDTETLDSSIDIQITADDGYSSESTNFQLLVTNNPPEIKHPIDDQVSIQLEQGLLTLKPGVRIDLQLLSSTFIDADSDDLSYSSTLSDGNALPEWLRFDSNNLLFYGTPLQVEDVTVSVIASDGYSSAVNTFSLQVQNKVPTLNISLQSQYETTHSTFLTDGNFFYFQFSSSTFIDEDDSLTYSVQLKENEGDWTSLDSNWLEFEGRTFSGTVSSDSVTNTTYCLQVLASDGYESVSDYLYFTVLSIFPEQNDLKIESTKSSIEIEVYTNGPKLAIFSHGSVSVFDMSNNEKTHWRMEGSPSDINYILDRVNYRVSSSRLLSESSVFLKIDGKEQEYPISVFTLRGPVLSLSIPSQFVYIDNTVSLYAAKYFLYSDQDALTYSFTMSKKPEKSKDWLSFDSRTVSGVPTDSNDTGGYRIEVTVEDEFEETSSESFELTVDYSFIQLVFIYLIFLIEYLGPAITLLGVFAFRTYIYNFVFKNSKKFTALEIKRNGINVRKLLILRNDEEKMAKKIYKKLPKGYEMDDENLVEDLDRLIQDINHQKITYSIIYPEVCDLSQLPSRNDSFRFGLENNDLPIVKIKKQNYHAKYLLLCVKDIIYTNNLTKNEKKELKTLVNEFKSFMFNSYVVKIVRKYSFSINSWIDAKDAWTVKIPDLCDLSIMEFKELNDFFTSCRTKIKYHVLLNRLRIEQWKNRAIRMNEKSNLDKVKVFYKTHMCCKLNKKEKIKGWLYRKWLTMNISDNEVVFEIDPTEKKIQEIVFVQLFDQTGYLIAELVLVPPSDTNRVIEEEDNKIDSRTNLQCENQLKVEEDQNY